MYVERNLAGRLRELLEHFPVVVVTGARQVGKSTLIAHEFGTRFATVVFDPVVDVGNARADPELFLQNHPSPLILDEIQYAPEILGALKRWVDRDRKPGRYILTGSQQWGVLKTVAESLAGRAVFLELDGFALNEAANQPMRRGWLAAWLEDPAGFPRRKLVRCRTERTLNELLWRGSLPEAQFLPLNLLPDLFAAYRRTYIERDVRVLAGVDDLHLFGRFFQLAAALTAQEINCSQVGRELGTAPQTARRWLSLLGATYQWVEVPAFSGNAIKRLSGKPKGYVADTGLACAAQMISTPAALSGHVMGGALFETAVMAEVRKQAALMPTPPSFWHWRTHGGAEVDVVLERDGVLYPIEVKMTSRPSRRDVKGLAAFRQTYPARKIAPGLIVAPTDTCFAVADDCVAVPWDVMLDE